MIGKLEIDYIVFKDKFTKEISLEEFSSNTHCVKTLLSELSSNQPLITQSNDGFSLSFPFSTEFILSNTKISKALKDEFAKGLRDIYLCVNPKGFLQFLRNYPVYQLVIDKDFFLDALEQAEEDAISRKTFKPEHFIEIVDIREFKNISSN